MADDNKLIQACKKADSKAQRELYKKYAPVLRGICYRYCDNKTEAADVLQEAFITIYTKIGQFAGSGSFEGWMKRITVNCALMHFRTQKKANIFVAFDSVGESKIGTSETEDSEPVSKAEIVKHADFSRDEILAVVADLPDGYRIVFNLFAVDGFKHVDIAKKLDISVGTSRSQLLRARAHIQDALYELALQKNKKRKRIAAIFSIAMGDDLKYIDDLVSDALGSIEIDAPDAKWQQIAEKMQNAKSVRRSLISQVVTTVVVTTAVISAVVAFFIFSPSADKGKQKEIVPTEIILEKDDNNKKINTNEELPSIESEDNKQPKTAKPKIDKKEPKTETTKTVIEEVHVPVKKVIRVKKRIIVRDTVFRTDTLKVEIKDSIN